MNPVAETFRRVSNWASSSPQRRRQIAVIDIGSNSVRLVIYDVMGRSIIARHNEKVMAGLGRGLQKTGVLSVEGKAVAHSAINRYHAILNALNVTDVQIIATAAVRDSEDGRAFIDQVYADTSRPASILSGEEEARLAALGVAAGTRSIAGVVGDLGGSSLELVQIDGTELSNPETFPLGPLAIGELADASSKRLRQHIRAALASAKVLDNRSKDFFAVGGAWRAFARVHMMVSGYPLHILHGYEIASADARQLAADILSEATELETALGSISSKRVSTLPVAAAVLKEILDVGNFDRVHISSYGLREGRVFDGLPAAIQAEEPLIAGIHAYIKSDASQIAFGDALYEFVAPVMSGLPTAFGSGDADARLAHACCHLADIGATFHPDYRADVSKDMALRAPFVGITHAERAFIALAIETRYNKRSKPATVHELLLTEQQMERAQFLGALMRAGATFSARSATVLRMVSLELDGETLRLVVRAGHATMISELVERRLSQAAQRLALKAAIDIR